MNLVFYLFFGLIGLLVLLFVWTLRRSKANKPSSSVWAIPGDFPRSHMAYLPQIRRALAKTDCEFVSERAPQHVQRRMRRERQRVGLAYLAALRGELNELLRVARIIAMLSPEVVAVQELERLRLTSNFLWRYWLIRIGLWAGYAPLPQMTDLSSLLSGFSVRLEVAMKELGERAALVAEIVSSPDRRRVHPI